MRMMSLIIEIESILDKSWSEYLMFFSKSFRIDSGLLTNIELVFVLSPY